MANNSLNQRKELNKQLSNVDKGIQKIMDDIEAEIPMPDFLSDEVQPSEKKASEAAKKENVDNKNKTEASVIGSNKKIKPGQHYINAGHLTLDFVPNNSKIIVVNGDLKVQGHVGENAIIKVLTEQEFIQQIEKFKKSMEEMKKKQESEAPNIKIGNIKATGQNAQAFGVINNEAPGNQKQKIQVGSIEANGKTGAAVGVVNIGKAPENQEIEIGSIKGSKGIVTAGVINAGVDSNQDPKADHESNHPLFDEDDIHVSCEGNKPYTLAVQIMGDVHANVEIHCTGNLNCRNIAENCIIQSKQNIVCENVDSKNLENKSLVALRYITKDPMEIQMIGQILLTNPSRVFKMLKLTEIMCDGSIQANNVGCVRLIAGDTINVQDTGPGTYMRLAKPGKINAQKLGYNQEIHIRAQDKPTTISAKSISDTEAVFLKQIKMGNGIVHVNDKVVKEFKAGSQIPQKAQPQQSQGLPANSKKEPTVVFTFNGNKGKNESADTKGNNSAIAKKA